MVSLASLAGRADLRPPRKSRRTRLPTLPQNNESCFRFGQRAGGFKTADTPANSEIPLHSKWPTARLLEEAEFDSLTATGTRS